MTLIFKVFRGGKIGSRLFCKVALTKEPNIKEIKTEPHEFLKYESNANIITVFCFNAILVRNQFRAR